MPLEDPTPAAGYNPLQGEVADYAVLAQHVAAERSMEKVGQWTYGRTIREKFQTPSNFSFHLRESKREHLHQPNTPRYKAVACTSGRETQVSAWISTRPSNKTI